MRGLTEGEAPVAGAEFTVWPATEWGYTPEGFGRVLRDYLVTCDLAATVTFNGMTMPTNCTGRHLDVAFAYGRVLSRKLPKGETTCSAFVRVKGLTMFREGVRSTDRRVIIELEGDFRAMFTSNRDGLRNPYREALGNLVQMMAVDAKSFDRKKDQTVLFPGTLQRYFQQISEAVRVLSLHMSPEQAHRVLTSIAHALHAEPAQPEAVTTALVAAKLDGRLSAEETAQVEEVVRRASAASHFITDFIVSIENTDYRQPPVRYTPGRMLRRHERTAKIWRHCINLVLKGSKENYNYRLGFVLDPDKAAYFKGDQNAGVLLINPDLINPGTGDKERFLSILQMAAHELAHRFHTWHDEQFVVESERLFRGALMAMASVSAELRAAQQLAL